MIWISTNERLPDISENNISKKVLIWDRTSDWKIGYYDFDKQFWTNEISSKLDSVSYWCEIIYPTQINDIPDQIFKYLKHLIYTNTRRCRIRVGGDNAFWEDISITSLPESAYFNELIVNFLNNSSLELRSLKHDNELRQISLVSNYQNAYAPSITEETIKKPFKDCYLYEPFLIFLGRSFDYEKYKTKSKM